jgi:hypothetical protein
MNPVIITSTPLYALRAERDGPVVAITLATEFNACTLRLEVHDAVPLAERLLRLSDEILREVVR